MYTFAQQRKIAQSCRSDKAIMPVAPNLKYNPGISSIIQTKLTMGTVGDRYEQEADQIADKVMRMPDSQQQAACACGTDCPKCQTTSANQVQLKENKVSASEMQKNDVPSIVHDVQHTSGQPLDAKVRDFAEPRFGHDFSKVRVHTDSQAAQAADSVKAHAYTVGNDIVFGQGQYQPQTNEGKKLLSHELTHVIQQNTTSTPTPTLQRQQTCAHPGDSRNLDLQPVFLRTDATDANPTGTSWTRRLNKANEIWGKLGVVINDLGAVTIDTPLKNTGASYAEFNAIRALRNGTGVEVFLVDNDITFLGGAGTWVGCDATVMSDSGTSDTLLAHEVGHTLGLGHDGTNSDPGTVMDTTGSKDIDNPEKNTMVNYNFITCPAASGSTCLSPDT